MCSLMRDCHACSLTALHSWCRSYRLDAIALHRLHWCSPARNVIGVDCETEKVRRDQAELHRPKTNDAENNAVNTSNDPALPHASADHACRDDGQGARQ